jgi:hypothetical protein
VTLTRSGCKTERATLLIKKMVTIISAIATITHEGELDSYEATSPNNRIDNDVQAWRKNPKVVWVIEV